MTSVFYGEHQPALVSPARSGPRARDDFPSVSGVAFQRRHLAVRRLNTLRTEVTLRWPYCFSSTKRKSFGHRLVRFVRMEYLLRGLVRLLLFAVPEIPQEPPPLLPGSPTEPRLRLAESFLPVLTRSCCRRPLRSCGVSPYPGPPTLASGADPRRTLCGLYRGSASKSRHVSPTRRTE